MPTIVSIQVGQPQTYTYEAAADGRGRTWTTAFFKAPVEGTVHVSRLGLVGDQQADLKNHGGVDKAVLAYAADHYTYWRQHLQLSDLTFGGFGENLTISGLEETSVCIGDQWQAGNVMFEVSQPRQPCWKMGRRWRIPDLPKQVIANGRSGWYLRVLQEGELLAGTTLDLIRRPHASWTIARASHLLYHQRHNLSAREELASLPELSPAWKEELREY